jgi:UDP-N-acetylmuramoyl-L-alanyl-D-glutamate--2,6-diaminopimelate ligase
MQLAAVTSIDGVRVISPGAGPLAAVRICDITEDHRTVVPGSLFIARTGLKIDGNTFIPDAIAAGAVAVLTDRAHFEINSDFQAQLTRVPILHAHDVPLATARLAELFWEQPSKKLNVIQVTGTNGKTTISTLIWQMLNAAGKRCGLIGTVLIDDGRSVEPAEMTTPPALEVSRALHSMAEAGCVAVVMEASSHALDQKRLDALSIDIGIFTNLSGDHLDYHKSMENYAAAKARLFEMLPAASANTSATSNNPAKTKSGFVEAHDPEYGRRGPRL